MSGTERTDQAAASAPPPPREKRTCRKCDEEKWVTPETWVYRKDRKREYHAYGTICLACEKARKAEYEKRRDEIAAEAKPPAPAKDKADKDDDRKAISARSKLDAALALKAGAQALNAAAPGILARVMQWAEDETDPQHAWAVEFLAQRILPKRLFEELGGQAAGVGALNDKRPQFVIQVLPAHQPGPPEPRVIEGQHSVVDVQALPSPQPEGASDGSGS